MIIYEEAYTFKRWYFGHYHDYKQVNVQFTLLYENIVPLKYESVYFNDIDEMITKL